MPSASTPVASALIGIRDRLTAIADALAHAEASALDEPSPGLADQVMALQQALTTDGEVSPALAALVDDARWQIERCRRLGAWLATWPIGSSPAASVAPTYLPTGQGRVMAAGHTSIEVRG
jgi:hypothetical protein